MFVRYPVFVWISFTQVNNEVGGNYESSPKNGHISRTIMFMKKVYYQWIPQKDFLIRHLKPSNAYIKRIAHVLPYLLYVKIYQFCVINTRHW